MTASTARAFMALVVAALVGLLAGVALGAPPLACAALVAAALLLAVAVVIDVRERRIPNAWTYPATGGALLLAAVCGPSTFIASLAGLALAGGLLGFLSMVGRGAIGMGDVKLAATVGALVGPAGAATFLVAGSAAGGILAIAWLLAGHARTEAMPYAPALAIGAVAALAVAGPVVA